MLLEVEMALEVKITWEKDNQDGGSTRGQHVAAVFGTFRTQFEVNYEKPKYKI